MGQQITAFEFVRLLLSLLVAVVVYVFATAYGGALFPELGGSMGLVVYLFTGLFVPAFLTIMVATLVPSWRYKMIAATLMLSAITIRALLEIFEFPFEFFPLLAYLIRLSASMSGALLAVYLWARWKANWEKRPRAAPAAGQPATTMPKTSPILLGLSLISIPITHVTIFASAFLVFGYSALLLLLLFEMPRIPIALLAAGFLAPLFAGWVLFRALAVQFFPKPPFQLAQSLPWEERPQLKQMIDEVCSAVKTRKPDNVILHIQPTFFVTQQKIKTYDTVVKGRTLAIGMPLLPHLTRQEFMAVLAHEFAHFSGSDTAYSVWVTPIYRSLGESIARLQQATSEAGNWAKVAINFLLFPSLLFLVTFYQFFASIDAIISRSRELRADWIAASHFGSNALTGALKKIVQYSTFFREQQEDFSLEKLESIGEIQEHYRLVTPLEPELLEEYLDEAMNVPESEFDSHPTIRTRFDNLPVTEIPVTENEDNRSNEALQQELSDDEAVLSAAYERMMMELREAILRYQQSQAS